MVCRKTKEKRTTQERRRKREAHHGNTKLDFFFYLFLLTTFSLGVASNQPIMDCLCVYAFVRDATGRSAAVG